MPRRPSPIRQRWPHARQRTCFPSGPHSSGSPAACGGPSRPPGWGWPRASSWVSVPGVGVDRECRMEDRAHGGPSYATASRHRHYNGRSLSVGHAARVPRQMGTQAACPTGSLTMTTGDRSPSSRSAHRVITSPPARLAARPPSPGGLLALALDRPDRHRPPRPPERFRQDDRRTPPGRGSFSRSRRSTPTARRSTAGAVEVIHVDGRGAAGDEAVR